MRCCRTARLLGCWATQRARQSVSDSRRLPYALLRAGSRPGRTSNFHLSGQMEVTKAKALNTSDVAGRIRATTSVACKGLSGAFASVVALPTANCGPSAQCSCLCSPAALWFCAVQPSRQVGASASRHLKACTPRWLSPDATVQIAGVEAVCFGDFQLGQQMKVTRPPGRDPARRRESRRTARHAPALLRALPIDSENFVRSVSLLQSS